MKIIGITGSSGSGKSSVCVLMANNAKVKIIDADKIAKDLQDRKTEYYQKIVETFGQDILDENKNIIRKKLAEIIFENSNEKSKLDKLTFKYVVDEIKKQIEIYKKENLDYIIVDAPTLIEANMNDMFDYIITVVAKKKNKINRICKRDNISRRLANKRLEAQKDDEFYKVHANFVIENNDENINKKVKEILQKMEGEKILK